MQTPGTVKKTVGAVGMVQVVPLPPKPKLKLKDPIMGTSEETYGGIGVYYFAFG